MTCGFVGAASLLADRAVFPVFLAAWLDNGVHGAALAPSARARGSRNAP